MACLDENVLAEYVDNVLPAAQRKEAQKHLDTCAACRAAVSDLARMQHATADETVDDVVPGENTNDTTIAAPYLDVAIRASAETLDAMYHRKRNAHIVPGTMIGEYEVTGTLGAGGMGVVFAAIHPRIGKKAAIKILQRDLARDPSAITRFENEARAVNAIAHPNIVDIFSFGELPSGDPYYVMEQVEGLSLYDWIHKHGPVPLERALPILRQICDALTAAHERGIIHRDLKPGNIMVSGSDDAPRVKVLDFGLAKMQRPDKPSDDLTNPGAMIGTPYFMSPEQFAGREIDQRSDVYALGVLVYQMLCGQYPFEGATPSAVREQHLHHTPAPLSKIAGLPPRLDRVIERALAKDLTARYASVRELRDALEKVFAFPDRRATSAPVVADEPAAFDGPTLPSGEGAIAPPPPPRRRVPAWVFGAVGLGVVAFAISWVIGHHSPEPPAPAPTPPPPPVETVEAAPAPAPAPPPAPAIAPAKDKEPAPRPTHHLAAHTTARPIKTAPPPPRAGSAASPDDDRMLLEGGTIKKKP